MQMLPRPLATVLDVPAPRRPAECPVEDWLTFLGHRWNALVLWHLSTGPKRYGELADCLPGVTPKVLVERLEGLERRALVTKSPIATFPRSVVYALSNNGRELVAILDRIEDWSKRRPEQAGPVLKL